jgi:membrane-associated protease RseP (regulator of RpoE activity)
MNPNPYESPKMVGLRLARERSTHGRAIVVALVQQTLLLLLAASVLDGGRLLRAFAGALTVSWAVSLILLLRRRDHPTTFDLAVIKYGFWFIIVLLLLMGPSMGIPIFGG